MDYGRVGRLIFDLRREKKLTQKELADLLHVSDRTVSKWERGLGCPDVSLLSALSRTLGVNIEKILSGDLEENDQEGGNMNRMNIYICPTCGNVLTETGRAELSCCGRKLSALAVNEEPPHHTVSVEEIENDYFVTVEHEMSKEHYISFAVYTGYDRVLLMKLYPEQNAALRFPKMQGKRLLLYCNRHGLWEKRL